MSTTVSGGSVFCELLTVLFIALKLTHQISWSWWWVLCPLWLPVAAILSLLGFVTVAALIVAAVTKA